jgi:hypothetical protein
MDNKNDAMEAFKTFSSARNLFFWVLLLAMLMLQVVFWMVDSGTVDSVLHCYLQPESGSQCPQGAVWLMVADQQDKTQADKNLPPPADENQTKQQQITPKDDISSTNKQLSACKVADFLQKSTKTIKYIATFAVVLYCLSLLISVKLTLVGQLGGMANAGKAFFLSLVVMVLIVPWQDVISPEVPGVLFSYKELTLWYQHVRLNADPPSGYLLYYGRFVGFWAFSMIVLLVAQWRSYLSVKEIRQRIINQQKQNNYSDKTPDPTINPAAWQTDTSPDLQ